MFLYQFLRVLNITSNISSAGSRICYENLGCFDTDKPFWSLYRPVSVLPQRPEKINTRFFLFTRSSVNNKEQLIYKNNRSTQSSRFSGQRKSKIVCHGFLENGLIDWMTVNVHTMYLLFIAWINEYILFKLTKCTFRCYVINTSQRHFNRTTCTVINMQGIALYQILFKTMLFCSISISSFKFLIRDCFYVFLLHRVIFTREKYFPD